MEPNWAMQTAPVMTDPRAYGKAYDKAAEEVYLKEINKLGKGLLAWKQSAINIQSDYDTMTVSAMSWRSVARDLRTEFAPERSNDDLRAHYNRVKPAHQKAYYNENIKDRHWDK